MWKIPPLLSPFFFSNNQDCEDSDAARQYTTGSAQKEIMLMLTCLKIFQKFKGQHVQNWNACNGFRGPPAYPNRPMLVVASEECETFIVFLFAVV